MKQKIQAVNETLCEITRHLDALREAAVDLAELGVSPVGLMAGVTVIGHWQTIVGSGDPLLGSRRLTAPVPEIQEDPPCIACGAPESVCECDEPDSPQVEMVSLTGAYNDVAGRMLCCGVDSIAFDSDDPNDHDPVYRCPECNRFDLGEHPDSSEARCAENAAGWDATP